MTTTVDAHDPALELVSSALIAKLAGSAGAPRLALAAARRTRQLADELTIHLSPLLAATSVEAEFDRLDGVRCTAQLAALLRPQTDEEPA